MSFRRSFYASVYFYALFHIKETSFVYRDKRGFFVVIAAFVWYNINKKRMFSVENSYGNLGFV